MTGIGRALLWVGLVAWTVVLLRTPLGELSNSILHMVNLPFHEAGHLVFAPFGSFMMSLGGSLLQLMVPVVCALAFLKQQDDPFAASVCVWWAGQNLLDLAHYIDDARSLQLMLLGGPRRRSGRPRLGSDSHFTGMAAPRSLARPRRMGAWSADNDSGHRPGRVGVEALETGR